MFNFIILTASALAVCSASPAFNNRLNDKAENRIVGGVETSIEQVPHQISLHLYGNQTCGGSLIDKKWVLTAAHCTAGLPADHFHVRVGSAIHSEGGKLVDVKRVIQHEDYVARTIDYDFALLELAEELEYNDVIQKVKLPEQGEPLKEGTMCEVSGWGDTLNLDESNEVLRATKIPVVDQEKCIKAYIGVNFVTDRMVCAGYMEGGKSSCNGDSGGPLLANEKLVGVVSWAKGCALRDYPSVFSRVAAVRDWINEKTGV